jgi:serine/threonine protein phosphatase 1
VTIFAIGDIHGCAAELATLLAKIDHKPGDTVVFLGDYIDRGPESAKVVTTVREYQPANVTVVRLRGNHEDIMLKVHEDRSKWDWWIGNGGGATLNSYGGEVPHDVLTWARALPTSFESDGHFFCHAGVDPERVLNDQDDQTLMWIRSKFLMSKKDFGKVVVHGHSPVSRPDVQPNRINVDTACVYGEALTCAVLDDGDVRFIRTPSRMAEAA